MQASTFVKTALIVSLGVCSAFITSSVMGQRRAAPVQKPSAAKTSKAAVANVRGAITRSAGHVEAVLPPGEQPAPFKAVASFHWQNSSVEVTAGVVTFSAIVDMMDTRPNVSYVWELSAKNNTNQVVAFTQVYDQQIFNLLDQARHNVTFKEDFTLKPGDYKVKLKLYQIASDSDIKKLIKNKMADATLILSGAKDVSIND